MKNFKGLVRDILCFLLNSSTKNTKTMTPSYQQVCALFLADLMFSKNYDEHVNEPHKRLPAAVSSHHGEV